MGDDNDIVTVEKEAFEANIEPTAAQTLGICESDHEW
jgi:hypothetical protein